MRVYLGNIPSWHVLRTRYQLPDNCPKYEPAYVFVASYYHYESRTHHAFIVCKWVSRPHFLYCNAIIYEYEILQYDKIKLPFVQLDYEALDKIIETLPIEHKAIKGFLRVWADQAGEQINWEKELHREDIRCIEKVKIGV